MADNPAWSAPDTVRASIAFASGADLPALREASLRALDAVQFARPAHQLQALFLLATAMAQSLNLDAHEMVSRAKRQLPDAEGAFTEQLQAARDYAVGELRR